VRGDDRLFLVLHREEDRGNEVGEAFADAGAGFDGEMFALLERARHRDGHLLLLRAKLEVFRARQNATLGEYLLDLFYQVVVGSRGLRFDDADHTTNL